MLRTVALWDPLKQRTPVSSLVYYARHMKRNVALTKRIEAFLERVAGEWISMRPEGGEQE